VAGLYIHIPFCRSKCAYCDFYSTPNTALMERYVNAISAEFHLRRGEIAEPITTIYLGGGTPSLIPDSLLEHLMHSLAKLLNVNKLREVTIEANPEDISPEQIDFYRSIGINRISIGIQSFHNDELAAISRKHSSESAISALNALKQSGINYSADLIYGLPGQTLHQWNDNLSKLFKFKPPHFSAYLLSYEPGTKLYALKEKGAVAEATETEAIGMYQLLCQTAIEAGYNHYEISNFSKPGSEAIHNSSYWNYTPYLGLGVAAHSFDGAIRRYNTHNILQFVTSIEHGKTFYTIDEELPTGRFNDYIITSLRTSAGFNTNFAMKTFGEQLVRQFMHNISNLITLPAPFLQSTALEATTTGVRIPETHWLTADAILRELIVDNDE
jgi:oxygen-independent coproporphyrinogen-3 oxidase